MIYGLYFGKTFEHNTGHRFRFAHRIGFGFRRFIDKNGKTSVVRRVHHEACGKVDCVADDRKIFAHIRTEFSGVDDAGRNADVYDNFTAFAFPWTAREAGATM